MADLTPDEVREGRWMLGGPRIVFWISLILTILGTIGSIVSFFTDLFIFAGAWSEAGIIGSFVGSIMGLICSILFVILYAAELSGIYKGRPYAVGLGRFLIIWMMIFAFPIGTIIGAVIWKRFSAPAAQKYLNYI